MEGLTIDEVNPLWLKTPAAPLTAAEVEKVEIDTEILLAAFCALQKRGGQIFVEGVGGWLVPIRADASAARTYFVRDLAVGMEFPAVGVAADKHCCLNQQGLT